MAKETLYQDIVTALYRAILGREPDAAGLRAHAEHLEKLGLDQLHLLIDAFNNSSEGRRLQLLRVLGRGSDDPHLYISLGTHCYTSALLKGSGRKEFSCPFDWVFSSPEMVLHCLETDFREFLDRDYYVPVPEAQRIHKEANLCQHRYYLENYKVNFVFNHRDPTRDENYAYFSRCVDRFRAAARSERPKKYVMVTRACSETVFHRLLEVLPNTRSMLLCIVVNDQAADAGWSEKLKIGSSRLMEYKSKSSWQPLAFADPLDDFLLANLILRTDPDSEAAEKKITVAVKERRDAKTGTTPKSEDDKPFEKLSKNHKNHLYLTPADLRVSKTPLRRIAVVGSCFAQSWNFHLANPLDVPCDYVITNNLSRLPDSPPADIKEYDFQIVQIGLRSILPDNALWPLKHEDGAAHERVFEETCARLKMQLDVIMRWNIEHGLLTFVANFMKPQQNLTGRLLPRYELTNPVYFIDQINLELSRLLKDYKNAYLLDMDEISATYGRMYFQEDGFMWLSHGALIPFYPPNHQRMEPLPGITAHYDVKNKLFIRALWESTIAMYRTLRQIDAVKLVVVDLDDTLWQGVSGERADVGPDMVEGWPLGIIEALCYLKKRGVLLAIISKNENSRIREIWSRIMRGRLSLNDFAVRRINWRSKVDNMREVLHHVNVLPRNTVFIDDNPVERAAMRAAYPDMRVLGKYPYYLKRILLWSPETQVAGITGESGRRTEMVRSQIEREKQRKALSREDFLASLALKARILAIDGVEHPGFARAFELINKTNQFNTNGRRWKLEECANLFGGKNRHNVFYAFEIEDKFCGYGLTAVVIVSGNRIEQFVMSCRVLGLDAELAIIAEVLRRFRRRGFSEVLASVIETDANFSCRDIYKRCGFVQQDGEWVATHATELNVPPHINMVAEADNVSNDV